MKTIATKKPATKQELIATNIKLLIEQLEAGHSEALTNYLIAMTVCETEAEAVAFIVGKAVGLVTGSASADYVVFAVM